MSLKTTDHPDDSELVLRARKGEEIALSMLIERYQKSAYALALSVTGRHEDAEDAAQESFLVALDQLDECRDPERFAGWFMTIVRNRSRNLIRRESLRETSDVPETSELRGILQQAIAALPEVQQEVVLLHDLEGWKHREIAERLGIPSGTVRSHLHFARKALKEALIEIPNGSDLIRKVQ